MKFFGTFIVMLWLTLYIQAGACAGTTIILSCMPVTVTFLYKLPEGKIAKQ